MTKKIRLAIKGFLIGIAETMPGVSGGTLALILGIYKELIESISSFGNSSLKLLMTLRLKDFALKVNLDFLLPIIIGMVLGGYIFSFVILFFLENYPFFLKALFSGLMIGSLIFGSIKPNKRNKSFYYGFLCSFFVFTLYGSSLLEFSDITLGYIFLSGFIAVCALILPGISGSFILLILGVYSFIIRAVNELDFLVLAVFFLGCLTGLLIFVRVIRSLYNRNENGVIGLFSGLILFSIPILWKDGPWSFNLPLDNIMIYLGLIFGLFLMLILKRLDF